MQIREADSLNRKAFVSNDISSNTNALPDIVKFFIKYMNSHLIENMNVSDLEKYIISVCRQIPQLGVLSL